MIELNQRISGLIQQLGHPDPNVEIINTIRKVISLTNIVIINRPDVVLKPVLKGGMVVIKGQ